MRQIIIMLFVLIMIGCAAPQKPVKTVPDSKTTTSELSLDERAKAFHNKIAGAQTTIDQATFLKYYRLRAAELAKFGQIKIGKPEVAKRATQLFRKIDRNHDKEISEEELKFVLAVRAQERRKLRRISPKEWNLLDDAFDKL